MNNLDFIREALQETELLAQLAEECAELGQAALKLRRALKPEGVSPTPLELAEALIKLREEIADVFVCLQVTGHLYGVDAHSEIEQVMRHKTRRWARRLGRREEDSE